MSHTRRRRTAAIVGAAACLGAVGLVFAAGIGEINDTPARESAPAATLLDPDERAALPEPLAADNAADVPGRGFAPILEDEPVPPGELREGEEEPLVQAVAGADDPTAVGAVDPTEQAAVAPVATNEDGTAGESAAPLAEVPPEQAAAEPTAPEPEATASVEAERCGAVTCEEGLVCCNESCGTCVRPGETCSQYSCASRPMPSSQFCGPTTCDVNEVCCNPSCGTCVAPGETCDLTACARDITTPVSYVCGMTTCNVGMVCCNPSCGICTPPNGTCSQEACD